MLIRMLKILLTKYFKKMVNNYFIRTIFDFKFQMNSLQNYAHALPYHLKAFPLLTVAVQCMTTLKILSEGQHLGCKGVF